MFGVFTWLFGLIKGIPGIGSIIGGIFSGTAKVAEIEAEARLEETRAFSRGRVSPRLLLQYVAVVAAACFFLMFIANQVWPGLFPSMALENLERIVKIVGSIMQAMF